MLTELFWIDGPWPGRLAISPRPRGGDWLEDEIRAWRAAGVDTVVSLVTPEEASDLDLEREEEICRANSIRFLSLPIVDRSVPASDSVAAAFVESVDSELGRGRTMDIHCRQGVGRAGLVASCLLIERGAVPEDAIRRVSEARGTTVPETAEQRDWIDHFAVALQRRR